MKKQNMYIRFIAAYLLILCITLFVGCEDDKHEADPEETSSPANQETSLPADPTFSQTFLNEVAGTDRIVLREYVFVEFDSADEPGYVDTGRSYTQAQIDNIIQAMASAEEHDIAYDHFLQYLIDFYSGPTLLVSLPSDGHLFRYGEHQYRARSGIPL
jgi:hypothetical protein